MQEEKNTSQPTRHANDIHHLVSFSRSAIFEKCNNTILEWSNTLHEQDSVQKKHREKSWNTHKKLFCRYRFCRDKYSLHPNLQECTDIFVGQGYWVAWQQSECCQDKTAVATKMSAFCLLQSQQSIWYHVSPLTSLGKCWVAKDMGGLVLYQQAIIYNIDIACIVSCAVTSSSISPPQCKSSWRLWPERHLLWRLSLLMPFMMLSSRSRLEKGGFSETSQWPPDNQSCHTIVASSQINSIWPTFLHYLVSLMQPDFRSPFCWEAVRQWLSPLGLQHPEGGNPPSRLLHPTSSMINADALRSHLHSWQ